MDNAVNNIPSELVEFMRWGKMFEEVDPLTVELPAETPLVEGEEIACEAISDNLVRLSGVRLRLVAEVIEGAHNAGRTIAHNMFKFLIGGNQSSEDPCLLIRKQDEDTDLLDAFEIVFWIAVRRECPDSYKFSTIEIRGRKIIGINRLTETLNVIVVGNKTTIDPS